MPMLMAVLTRSNGLSRIEETIFSNRFMSAPELVRMGAKINIKGSKAIIIGKDILNAADCISSDLRSTFAIILAQWPLMELVVLIDISWFERL